MANLLQELQKKGLIHPPNFLVSNTHYLVYMGSVAYGVSSDNSDNDLYGFCIPEKEMVFPHLKGEILGFGKQTKRFEQYQEQTVTPEGKKYDFAIYSIVKFFQLVMENNPNMVDSLFVPQRCIVHSTAIGNLVRENRKMFLHKGCWPKFKGYSYSQLHKADLKNPIGKRKETIEKYGVDTKYLYHVCRLLLECEQILSEHDLDLERNKEFLKEVRKGSWSLERTKDFFQMKERHLEELYNKSSLPYKPDEDKIKELLLNCLEMHYGSLDKAIKIPNKNEKLLRDLENLVEKYKK